MPGIIQIDDINEAQESVLIQLVLHAQFVYLSQQFLVLEHVQ